MEKRNEKKWIAWILIMCLIITSFGLYDLNPTKAEAKNYVVITKEGNNKIISTCNISSTEAERMKQSKDVLVVEEDSIVKGSSIPTDEMNYSFDKEEHEKKTIDRSSRNSDEEWNLQMIKSVETATGSALKVKVAIIDSGVDYSDDIDVKMRKNFIPGEDDISVFYEDGCGHGTGVAGIIAAKDNDEGITGVNPNVELYSAKVLDRNNSAPISRVVEAIYWAISNNVNIINISFGITTDSEALRLAIQDAYNAGILIIAAAGNNGVIEYPAAYDEVMAVGSVNSMGERSSGSATGEDLEIMAPGELIKTTGAFGGVMVSSGTSMAAPHVVGAAALLWQQDLSCSSDFIRRLLDYSANKYGDSNEYGNGLLDLKYAFKIYDKFKKNHNKTEEAAVTPTGSAITPTVTVTEEAAATPAVTATEGVSVTPTINEVTLSPAVNITEEVAVTPTESVTEEIAATPTVTVTDEAAVTPVKTNKEGEPVTPTIIITDEAVTPVVTENHKSAIIPEDTASDIVAKTDSLNLNWVEIIPENATNVIVFNDVDYVDGSWGDDEHNVLNSNQLDVVKLGAQYNDDFEVKGMDLNPQWHGYWQKKTTNDQYGKHEYLSNYMACYLYLTQIASELINNDSVPDKTAYYISGNDYSAIRKIIKSSISFNGVEWSNVLGNNENTKLNRGYFVYGMALHSATDIFAHNTYIRDSVGEYHYFGHLDCDRNLEPNDNRFTCAGDMVKIIAGHISSHNTGQSSDFVNAVANYSPNYKVRYYKTYLKEIGDNAYTDDKFNVLSFDPAPPEPGSAEDTPTAIPTPVQCPHQNCEARTEQIGTCYYTVKIYCKDCGSFRYTAASYYSHNYTVSGYYHICMRCGYKYK